MILELLGLMRRVNSVLNVEAYRHTRSRIISSYNNETMYYDTALTLLLKFSDNHTKQSQFNTVVVQQKEVDWVGGFEPTTLAASLSYCSYLPPK
jgi:hypothetical protein